MVEPVVETASGKVGGAEVRRDPGVQGHPLRGANRGREPLPAADARARLVRSPGGHSLWAFVSADDGECPDRPALSCHGRVRAQQPA